MPDCLLRVGRRSPASNHVEGGTEDRATKNSGILFLHADRSHASLLPLPHHFYPGRILPVAVGPLCRVSHDGATCNWPGCGWEIGAGQTARWCADLYDVSPAWSIARSRVPDYPAG